MPGDGAVRRQGHVRLGSPSHPPYGSDGRLRGDAHELQLELVRRTDSPRKVVASCTGESGGVHRCHASDGESNNTRKNVAVYFAFFVVKYKMCLVYRYVVRVFFFFTIIEQYFKNRLLVDVGSSCSYGVYVLLGETRAACLVGALQNCEDRWFGSASWGTTGSGENTVYTLSINRMK